MSELGAFALSSLREPSHAAAALATSLALRRALGDFPKKQQQQYPQRSVGRPGRSLGGEAGTGALGASGW